MVPSTKNCIAELLRRGWNLYAPLYDLAQPFFIRFFRLFGDLSYDEFEEALVESANLKPGQRVLDVACGTGPSHGALSRAVGKRGNVVAVDFSPRMLALARERGEELVLQNISYREADAELLSSYFKKESFDAITSCNGLPNFTRPEKALSEMAHVLKPGGTIAISTINRDKCEGHPLWRWATKFPAGHFLFTEELGDILRRLGFTRINNEEQGMMLIVTARKRASRKIKKGKGTRSGAGRTKKQRKTTDRRSGSVS